MAQTLGYFSAGGLTLTLSVQDFTAQTLGFGPAIFVSSDTTFDGTERYREYTNADDVATDLAATEISATAAAAAVRAFAQTPKPSRFLIGRRNGGGSEAWATALSAIVTAGANFSWLTIDSRTIADQVAAGEWATARKIICIVQSADSSWLNSGAPSGWADHAHLAPVYHPSTAYLDVEWAATLSAYDTEERSVAGMVSVAQGAVYSMSSSTEISAAFANGINLALPNQTGGTDRAIRKAFCGGPTKRLEPIINKLWADAQIVSSFDRTWQGFTSSGKRFPVTQAGLDLILADLEAVGEKGVRLGYLTPQSGLDKGYAFAGTVNASTKAVTVTGRFGNLNSIETISVTVDMTGA